MRLLIRPARGLVCRLTQEVPKRGSSRIDEYFVDRNSYTRSKGKGQDHATSRDGHGGLGITLDDSDVDLEANEEQEQDLVYRNRLSLSQGSIDCRKRTKPMLATNAKKGLDCSGKTCSVKPGMRPMAVGPSMMPPSTSAMTLGCFILPRTRDKSWVISMITPVMHVSQDRPDRNPSIVLTKLHNKESDWILGVELGGVIATEETTLK
jgi:hypothetical protein